MKETEETVQKVLLEKGLEVSSRILGHADRNPISPTYGIFERKYWAWKMAPFADASNQYAVYYLALLWGAKSASNPFYHSARVLAWAEAGMEAWCRLQHKDGSFDQAFAHEHSVGATSYTCLGMMLAEEQFAGAVSRATLSSLHRALDKAGDFLCRNEERYAFISNHVALFAVTFHELWKRTGERTYRMKARACIDDLLHHASAEGWLPEYEGADIGYLSQCVYYLAYLCGQGWDELRKPLERALDFISFFVHPDGSMGGCYASRDTVLVYPAGFALCSQDSPVASGILFGFAGALRTNTTPTPADLDFPNALRLGANYLVAAKALLDRAPAAPARLPWQRTDVHTFFGEAGLLVHSNERYYAVIGAKKGGVFKAYDKRSGAMVAEDRGWCIPQKRGDLLTQMQYEPAITTSDHSLTVHQPFFRVTLEAMGPGKYFCILSLAGVFFRVKLMREFFKKMLVGRLITGRQATDKVLTRTISFDNETLGVRDTLSGVSSRERACMRRAGQVHTVHMASAQYFDRSLLDTPADGARIVRYEGKEE